MAANGKLIRILETTLDNLPSSSFKYFKSKLTDCTVPTGHKNIPRNKLEEADPQDVVDLIIRYHTTEHAPQIVMKVLEDINERQACLDLKTELNDSLETTNHSNKQYRRVIVDDDDEPVLRKKKITHESPELLPSMEKKYKNIIQLDSSDKYKTLVGRYHSDQIPVNINRQEAYIDFCSNLKTNILSSEAVLTVQEKQNHSYPCLSAPVTPGTSVLKDILINKGPLSDSNNTSPLEESSEQENTENYKQTKCPTPLIRNVASLKLPYVHFSEKENNDCGDLPNTQVDNTPQRQHNRQQHVCTGLAHYPTVEAGADKQGIINILTSDCSPKPFLQETHINGTLSDSIKQTAKEIDGQVTEQLQQHHKDNNQQQENVAFSQSSHSEAAIHIPVIERVSPSENISVQVLQETNDIGHLSDHTNANVGEAAKQINSTQVKGFINHNGQQQGNIGVINHANPVSAICVSVITRIPSQDHTFANGFQETMNHCIPSPWFINNQVTEQRNPCHNTLQQQESRDHNYQQSGNSALETPTIALFCNPNRLSIDFKGTTTTCGPLLSCINELVKNMGSQSNNTIQLPGYNNQEQSNIKLIHSPIHPPAIPTPVITRISTSEPVVECLQGKEKSNGPLSVSTNKHVEEEVRQINISTQLQESTVHNNQTQGNIELTPKATPCSVITKISPLDPLSAECSKETSINKGPSSGPPKEAVGQLGNPVENNLQAVSPIRLPTGPTPEAAIASTKIVPLLQNKVHHCKPFSDRTNQPNIKHIPPRGKPLPDMPLPELDEKNLALIEANHKGQPHIYAKLLFRFFVPYETYKDWVKKTNFDGFGGKDAIPNNLREAILKQLRKKFHLKEEDIKKIKQMINNLLLKLRTGGWPLLMLYYSDTPKEPCSK